MSHKLNALGLAVVAALALSATLASAAQALNHDFTVPTKPAAITAEDTVNTVFSFTEGIRKIECTTTKYEGTVALTTGKELTVTPTYSGCSTGGGVIPVTVDVNHCAFILTGETDAEGKDAKTHLECAKNISGEDTELTFTYSVLGSSCVIHVTPQTPEGGIHYLNGESEGKKDVTVEFTVKGMKYHETGGGFCPASQTGTDGTLDGTVTAKAYVDLHSELTGTAKTTPTFSHGDLMNLEVETT